MKKAKILLTLLSLFSLLSGMLFSCGSAPGGKTTPPATRPPETSAIYHTVTISTGAPHCQIIGESSVTVPAGGTATFRVMLTASYVLEPEIGSYDAINGYYTIEGVSEDLSITLAPIYVQSYKVTVTDADASINGRHDVGIGSSLTLAPDASRGEFIGWSSGARLANGGKLFSGEAELVFTPSANVSLYANYATDHERYLLYDLNGGRTDTDATTYLQALDTSFYTAPNSLNDRKLFTRAGYALLEYNTKADGTGTGYSLGSKIKLSGGVTTLYCIWAEETDARFFTTQPTAVAVNGRPVVGLSITGYTGTASEVVIPETVDGEPVIQIASGAFRDASFTSVFLTNNLVDVQRNAFSGCGNLETVYLSDSVLRIPDNAFDTATYGGLRNLYINAVREPVFCSGYDGAYRIKWDRLIEGSDGDMIVYVSGSSGLHGLATEYLEALLDQRYTVVNYGTVRTTNALFYLEAVSHFTDEGDIVIWGPENSEYQFGGNALTYKLFRDLEGSLNAFRYVDISNYELVFSAFSEYQSKRLSMSSSSYDRHGTHVDENGDYQDAEHRMYNQRPYADSPFDVTLEDMKSTIEVVGGSKDNTPPIPLDTHATLVKRILGQIAETGAVSYFGFCTVDAGALVSPGNTAAGQAAYDAMIREIFGIELLGSVSDHIFPTEYFYKANASSFHVNDYGRAKNTYQLYLELCEKLNLTPKGSRALGTDFDGCLFE